MGISDIWNANHRSTSLHLQFSYAVLKLKTVSSKEGEINKVNFL